MQADMEIVEYVSSRSGSPEAVRLFIENHFCSNPNDALVVLSEFEDSYKGYYDTQEQFAEEEAEFRGYLTGSIIEDFIDWGEFADYLFNTDFECLNSEDGGIYVFRNV